VTDGVDLPDDALAIQFANEFVTGDSSKWVIAACQLDVGIADAGEQHANHRRVRFRDIGSEREFLILEPERAHELLRRRDVE
jgi:hypothetical protein